MATTSKGLTNIDGDRPDLRLHGWGREGRDLDVDFSIPFSGSDKYLHHCLNDKNYALSNIERTKNNKYKERCEQNNIDFLPLCIDTFGCPTKTTVNLVLKLVKRAAEVSQIPKHILSFYWKKRISTSIQKCNARLMINATKRIFEDGTEGNSDTIKVHLESMCRK